MNKQETASYLKEILTKCNLTSDSFILIEPNPNDTLSKGYKIRIITALNNACREQVKTITKKHDLAVIEEQNQIIVYKPKSTQIDFVWILCFSFINPSGLFSTYHDTCGWRAPIDEETRILGHLEFMCSVRIFHKKAFLVYLPKISLE